MTENFTSELRDYLQQIVEDGVRKVLKEEQDAKEDARMFYTKNEAAERLAVSTSTLYRLAKLYPGQLCTIKTGKKLLFTKESIESFIEKKEGAKTK